METKTHFDLRFGAMSDKISKQLKQQKLKFDLKTVAGLQDCADAITRLRLHSLLSDAEHKKIQQRLFNKIEKHVQENNKS